ncbi:MAG: hypothetical protein A3J07_03295 [Candidatus Doudnabacteria bacterium RIFCSPLOWO2_02_FULL_49_13]|uniref:Rod shape-determining protein MreD n=1 Tax=Candidatus Doudnabacteria bacterium RIFCSPHIGHO2_12_FULL_48_16 TaxID=1817838 RepID=A0A1F5PJB2_9BACT|nr:MAG: hypothetical protein A3B77_02100 [Candidatus Doudnabacteria bacterium RIFCSPHIGHO2_02_FULL_49_24]OGE89362.1 MAG: hypothetical protein A2760_03250 [Candidatus Doudnabacteria bacterium RIFCSPHIGHO2_01_FULL_50_67]OGE89947.1 MAG: hypothetical protein A3E29_02440 [Candidatus Doudnabacteria bacterium RIFCSPHIGHO2_12_FULL_48_16]OGE97508.1 MAG: hypothetical protein A2990_02195 [Candidatus Doudnabacteria bacterium RIFCSPLOWO2_01_FULL_49_40]OGF03088.1 MAG: hypothetical protein A3J07_03295 [Candid
MKIFIWILAVFSLLVLQNGVLAPLHLMPANLILVLMIMALLFDGIQTALIICLSGGIMLDFLAGANLGQVTLALLFTALISFTLFELFISREPNWMLVAVCVAGVTGLFAVGFALSNWLFGSLGIGLDLISKSFWTNQFPLSLIFNLIFAYPVAKYFSLTQFVYAKSIRH